MIISRKIETIESELIVTHSLEIKTGEVRQLYNPMDGQYYADRRATPLVVQPRVSYYNPDTGATVENALPELDNIRWYRLDADTGDTGISDVNLVDTNATTTNGEKLYVVDDAPGSATKGKLTVRENINPEKPVTYVFMADITAGKKQTVMLTLRVSSQSVSVVPDIYFDNNMQGVYNPLEDPAQFKITPKANIDGVNVTFKWQTLHDGVWGDAKSTPLDWAIIIDPADGSLSIDRSIMQDELNFKCIATIEIDGQTLTLSKRLSHTRRLPELEGEIESAGSIPAEVKTIYPTVNLRTSRKVNIGGDEMEFQWYAGGTQSGNTVTGGTLVGTGISPAIPASLVRGKELHCVALDRGGYKMLVDSDGAYLTDSDGKKLIIR